MSPRNNELRNPVLSRVFLLAAALALASGLEAADRPAPKYVGGGKPDPAEGAKVLEQFQRMGIQGDHWMEFELRDIPHRGRERVLKGQWVGRQTEGGAQTHVVVTDPANTGGSRTEAYLIHQGPQGKVWHWNHGQRGITPGAPLDDSALLGSISGTDLTAFDLLMPFLHWKDHAYEGVAKVRNRPSHSFLLYPPSALKPPANETDRPAPAAVRVFLDTQFGAMTQAEWVDAAGKPMKTVTVLDLKKTGEQWIVKSIDLRNHQTKGKSRLAFSAAAFDLELPDELFEPGTISVAFPEIPPGKMQRF